MNTRTDNRALICDLLLASALTLPVSAAMALVPDHYDGSLFVYIGQRWAHGVLPYVQVFDHKPPGIFALIALATLINPSLWMLALVEFLFSVGCIASVRAILRRLGAPRQVLLFGTVCTSLVVNLRAYLAGNMTETYLLLPMTASMVAFIAGMDSGKHRHILVAGLCSGAASLFKPFGISALLAQLVVSLFRHDRRVLPALRSIAVNLAGVAAAWVPFIVYFWLRGGLKQMLDASFLYSLRYGIAGQHSLLSIPGSLAYYLIPFAPMVVCITLGAWMAHRHASEPKTVQPIWTLVALWFGFGLLLVMAAGHSFEHYFLSLAPALALGTAMFFWAIAPQTTSALRQAMAAIVLAPVALSYYPGISTPVRAVVAHGGLRADQPIVEELKRLAKPSSSLLVWGYDPWVFYSTHLRNALLYPSTHYIYGSPASYRDIGEQILSGMHSTPPDFVVVSPEGLEVVWPMKSDPVKEQFDAILSASYIEVARAEAYRLYRHR